MINITNELYTLLVHEFDNYTPQVSFSQTYTNTPSSYPFVSFEEIDNSIYENGSDDMEIENFANVDYEVNIYAKDPLRKSKADAIANKVDTLMKSKGFIRRTKNPFEDKDGATYRIVMRYSGVVSKNKIVYRG